MRPDALIVTLGCAGLFACGCASSTTVLVRPAEADALVSIDGGEVGPAPVVLREHVWFWSERTIEVAAPGFAPQRRTIEAEARPVNLAICALTGCISWLFWPIALQGAYPDGEVVLFELERDARSGASEELSRRPIRALGAPDLTAIRWGGAAP